LRNSGTFKGYYRDDDATRAALVDGWLRTGDAGYIGDHGHVIVVDRIRDVLSLSDGTQVAPQSVEGKLTFSPYIKEAVVIGMNRPYLTALICIEGRVVGKWAGDNKISYTSYSNLASRPEVADFIQKEVARANQELPESTRIKRFALLYKDLDADEEELTRTGKARRGIIHDRYRVIIDGLYTDVESLPVDVTVELQDGKSSRINSMVHFRDLR